jgi:hypothetical protein
MMKVKMMTSHNHIYAYIHTDRVHVGAVYLATDDEGVVDDITQTYLCTYIHSVRKKSIHTNKLMHIHTQTGCMWMQCF